jgi:FAD/FMN-containing dehydrogenase
MSWTRQCWRPWSHLLSPPSSLRQTRLGGCVGLAVPHFVRCQPYHSKQLRGVTINDLEYFRSILSSSDRSILSSLSTGLQPSDANEDDELARYNRDWTGHYHGSSQLILRPKNTFEVSSILRYCHENFIGLVPQGGNTGLCGGATPIQDEIILSLEDMNTINHIDEHSGILTCDAGVILQNLHDYASDNGRLFPLDIGSKGTCQIGGNVSTNAGGQYFFRFGGLHGTVMGLEVVLPDGRVMQLNMNGGDDGGTGEPKPISCTHRKDNTGYDLKHLFIGAEGTLGIVTKVAIACPALPSSKNATMLVCSSYDHVLKVLRTAHDELGEILSAFELIDTNTLHFVQQHGYAGVDGASRLVQDILESDESTSHSSGSRPLFLLVETQGSNSDHDSSKMESFLERLFDSNTIQNGVLANDMRQMNDMWSIREACNPCVARAGCVYKFDVSIPIEEYIDVALELERLLLRFDVKICVWGHVADGNAHINIVTPGRFEKDYKLANNIQKIVYDTVLKRHGSISAEHGIGQSKKGALGRFKDANILEVMGQIKAFIDPHGIMNPGKVLPRT